jgi:hypothetical protein
MSVITTIIYLLFTGTLVYLAYPRVKYYYQRIPPQWLQYGHDAWMVLKVLYYILAIVLVLGVTGTNILMVSHLREAANDMHLLSHSSLPSSSVSAATSTGTSVHDTTKEASLHFQSGHGNDKWIAPMMTYESYSEATFLVCVFCSQQPLYDQRQRLRLRPRRQQQGNTFHFLRPSLSLHCYTIFL